VTLTEKEFRNTNRIMDADALKVISSEPGTTWLVGPNSNDPTAQKDIQTVIRTSSEAANLGTTPVYQLYAIPHRDACAEYSKGGFNTPKEYTNWINQIVVSVKTPSVFLIETDSIGNIATKNCLSPPQVREREQLLKATVEKLRQSPNALAIYIDAAHSEWFPDPSALVGPLKRSGFDSTDGIFVNTSFFAETEEISQWSKMLLNELGGEKGVIIDTGRNGNGKPLQNITGEARWCNPDGRSVGTVPSTQTGVPYIHAYLWIKNIGESDGSCFGYPSAGTFVPELALKLVRNR
jgi:endoglucanase